MATARERWWSVLRLVLGLAQIVGASAAFVLLFGTGISTLTIGFTVATCLLTTISVILFGSQLPKQNTPA